MYYSVINQSESSTYEKSTIIMIEALITEVNLIGILKRLGSQIFSFGLCKLIVFFFICSQFEKLSEVALRGLPVSQAGQPGVIAESLPNVSELDISDSLISNWTKVAKITSQLTSLRTLNVR